MGKINRRFFMGTLAAASAAIPSLRGSFAASPDVDVFMKVSRTLTGRSALDQMLGQRYLDALQKHLPDAVAGLSELDAAATSGTLSALQQISAMKILRAWYTGQVAGHTVAYEAAFMFEAMGTPTPYIPTYCATAPGGWASKPNIT